MKNETSCHLCCVLIADDMYSEGIYNSFMVQVLQTIELVEPGSQARARPDYSAEVLCWRAQLRPFLTGESGLLSRDRPLESLSSGLHMAQGRLNSGSFYLFMYLFIFCFSCLSWVVSVFLSFFLSVKW